MDYLVPEMQSYHFDMGSLSGAGEVDAASHFRELYGGRGQASFLCWTRGCVCGFFFKTVGTSSRCKPQVRHILKLRDV